MLKRQYPPPLPLPHRYSPTSSSPIRQVPSLPPSPRFPLISSHLISLHFISPPFAPPSRPIQQPRPARPVSTYADPADLVASSTKARAAAPAASDAIQTWAVSEVDRKGKKKKGTLGVGNGAVFFASESDKVRAFPHHLLLPPFLPLPIHIRPRPF